MCTALSLDYTLTQYDLRQNATGEAVAQVWPLCQDFSEGEQKF
jgi:hypothetical protein